MFLGPGEESTLHPGKFGVYWYFIYTVWQCPVICRFLDLNCKNLVCCTVNAGGKPSHWDLNSDSQKSNFSHKVWLLHVLSRAYPIHGICYYRLSLVLQTSNTEFQPCLLCLVRSGVIEALKADPNLLSQQEYVIWNISNNPKYLPPLSSHQSRLTAPLYSPGFLGQKLAQSMTTVGIPSLLYTRNGSYSLVATVGI